MPGTLRILAVGPPAFTSLVRHALVDRRPLSLSVAVSYWDLCSLVLRETEQVSVAILESSISEFELRLRAEHIRRRWPDAEILLVGRDIEGLDDRLYDERVPAGIAPTELCTVIGSSQRERKMEADPMPVHQQI